MGSYHGSSSTRGLSKSQLGGIIFGSTETTLNECLWKKLFGLPGPHFVYVKKIEPGLPLFLFNYTNRTLLGIFEAASAGQMNIDSCAWTCEGSQKTPYPAQTAFFPSVEVSNLKSANCLPVNKKQVKTFNTITEKDAICMKLKEMALNRKLLASGPTSDNDYMSGKLVGQGPLSADSKDEPVVSSLNVEKKEDSLANSSKTHPMIAQLILKVEELMASKATQKDRINHLEDKAALLEQNLAEAQAEIKKLKVICNTQELETCVGVPEYNYLKSNEINLAEDPILLVGGYDGGSWLSSLDCYSPSQNLTKSLSPMNIERCYAAVSKLDGEVFVFGGGTCGQWFDTVESYDPVGDRWTTCPPLSRKNGSLAGVTVNDKIYAVGGGNGVDCYSNVEMLDFDVGSWIPARSMLEKRFALAAAELNGAIYAVGGYDGKSYLRTAERFDPREHSWNKIESMSTMRGCPSMVVFNEKLYVLGGYDGKTMVSTVEIYDPRRGSWVFGEPMNHPRGFSAAAVAKDSIYIIGGLKTGDEINDTVECYKDGRGWEMTRTNDACRRCFLSAVAL